MDRQRPGDPGHLRWGGPDSKIVVPLDGSAEAKLALPVAQLIAQIAGAIVHVLHVSDRALRRPQLLQALKMRRSKDTTNLIIAQAAGSPAEGIVGYATRESAMLIVMTARGGTAYQGRVLRSVTEQVACKAACPVLVVRPEQREYLEAPKLRHILLPLDGAPSTEILAHPAVSLAEQSGAELDILYVTEAQASMAMEAGTITAPRYVDQPQYEWPAWTQEFIERFCACAGECPSRSSLSVRKGDPATEILTFARQHHSDLIVLEWHCSLEPGRANVVRSVLADSPCPVMLIPYRP